MEHILQDSVLIHGPNCTAGATRVACLWFFEALARAHLGQATCSMKRFPLLNGQCWFTKESPIVSAGRFLPLYISLDESPCPKTQIERFSTWPNTGCQPPHSQDSNKKKKRIPAALEMSCTTPLIITRRHCAILMGTSWSADLDHRTFPCSSSRSASPSSKDATNVAGLTTWNKKLRTEQSASLRTFATGFILTRSHLLRAAVLQSSLVVLLRHADGGAADLGHRVGTAWGQLQWNSGHGWGQLQSHPDVRNPDMVKEITRLL